MLSPREIRVLHPNVDEAWQTTKKKRKGSRFVCCLLEGGDCTIYADRPILCRLYPFFAVPSDELALLREPLPKGPLSLITGEGVRFYFIYDDSCPGMGKGEKIKPDGILKLTLVHVSEMKEKLPG
jgi:Fe-S-cluster containining protein